ncbi:response regulator [Endozoicomonas sp. SM1973]|uniref:histidine kinase n=1 Tax=Spartinivicinus marinus TaxID=2994442 RepID=A0A853IHE6_9GAMM|nr:response regulator [Spartinivicinus marinus]MCX4025873.1 response regulator [Spartinivicinus marinus]NYZ68857.1 response regulator [Spartinivicinus marinus]
MIATNPDSVHAEQDIAEDKILLVDDNPTNLQLLLQTLNGRGYKLLVAKNGESALKIAQKNKPALILLDIMMPGIDGYEVCRQLKASADTNGITVIFLSALDETKDKVKGLNLGAVDFISKPFQPEEVLARVATQLKIHRLERALSERNKQLEADNQRILEAMTEGIFGLDQKGCITFVNAAANRMTGFSEDDLIGKELINILLKPNDPETVPILKTLQDGSEQHIEEDVFWHHNGHHFPVTYSVTPINTDHHPSGAVVVFKDITERKQNEEALQKALDELQEQKERLTHVSRLSTMGEMAAGFAHEVNQPLTAICNYAQVCNRMIQRDPLNKESLSEALEKIGTQARRAGDIIARIRSFVKKPAHCLEKVDCNKLISDVVKLAEVDARNNNMEIHLDLADELPLIEADPVQIQQVALNLIRNGMEAMGDRETRDIGVWVKTELDKNHQFVKVSVIDRGHGLTEDAADKLFHPFFTTKSYGMGIGLSVCESIISTHGGKLRFENNPEGGAIFYFTVPTV